MARVLIVDDEPDIRLLCRFYLESEGHEVIEAAGGKEGIDVLKKGLVDLIFLDIRLPDMDGWDVLEEVAELPGKAPTVVMMSAHASPSTLDRAERAGAAGYVVKPFREEDLLRWV
jgi:CheY-like chemotaxis protein